MLPSNLLRTQKRRDTIKPIYAPLIKENLEVADLLIHTYKENVERKKIELDEVTQNLEDLGYDYRFIRGLTALLDRKCKLASKSPIESSKIRRMVFTLTQRDGLPTTNQARKKILDEAANNLHLPSENIEEYLYADLEDQQIIESFEEIDAENLLKRYNLSLTQTLLFCATELCFTTTGNWQEIFKKIKWLSLIYNIQKIDDSYVVTVDGPASIFKLNRKYGTKIAKLLPSIIANKKWRITAKILRYKRDTQLLNLQLDSIRHREILMSHELSEPAYDSLVEKDFANRFGALDTGWSLEREPEPIPVGKWVMIPDFKFQKGKMSVYLEVAGFWTPKYLENKIKKLSLLDSVDFIVAADKKLECQKMKKIGDRLNLFFYKKRIPLKPLLKILKRKEEAYVEREIAGLHEEIFSNLKYSLIEFSTLAMKFDVLEESIKRFLGNREVYGYVNLGDSLISKTKLREIERELYNRLKKNEVSYTEAVKLVEKSGGKNPIKILEVLKFGVKWHGIDPDSARIYKNNPQIEP
jgi:predicted nuclease of restriction endonuclease-like RecB superfamily